MKEERLICPTTPKLSTVTERCLKTKLRITTTPRNGHIHFVCAQHGHQVSKIPNYSRGIAVGAPSLKLWSVSYKSMATDG